MSLTLPIAVRLSTAKGTKQVTRDLHDLTYRSTVPGGYASAQFALSRPLSLQPEEIAEFGQVVVYDQRSGETLWEGRLEDPGRSVGDSGEIWQISATGPSAHAQDRTISVIYADRNVDNWEIGAQSVKSVDVSIDDESGIGMSVANGTTWSAGTAGLAVYHALEYTGQTLARVTIPWSSGFVSSNMEARLSTSLGTGASITVDGQAISPSTSGTLTGSRGGANAITSGHDTVRLRFVRNVSNFLASSDDIWIRYTTPQVRGLLKDVNGNDITSGYNLDTIRSDEVVRDLLGRLLPRYDGPNASVATGSFGIDQLAYPDGASSQKILEDLMTLEPTYYWAAWESGTNGRHRFEWTTWPSQVRYEATTAGGFDSPSSAGELFDAVSVRWRNAAGVGRTVRRTQTVAALAAAGLTREAYVDLADEIGSASTAQQAGDAFLADHAVPVNAGTLTVTQPIMDFVTCRLVDPWQIKPGALIRVRDVLPRIGSINAGARDGVTIFKVTAVDFNAGQCAATLELDSHPMSIPRAVADLSKRRVTRKR